MNSQPTFFILTYFWHSEMAILRSSFKFCWMQIFAWIKFTDILALCETTLDDSIDSGNFSVRVYLSLIQKNYFVHTWSCSLCEIRTSFCMGLISRKLFRFVCFGLDLLHSVPYFFSLYWSPSSSLCTVFEAASSNVDEVISINLFAKFFFLKIFISYFKILLIQKIQEKIQLNSWQIIQRMYSI